MSAPDSFARQRRLRRCGRRWTSARACSFAVALTVALAARQAALGAITTTLVEIPISPAAVAADPVLAGNRSFDLRIDVPPGLSWGYTGFLAELTQGSFYNPALGHQIPLPQLWGVFPNLRYDTFVTQAADPDDDSTFVAPFLQHGYPEYPAPIEFTDTRTSVVYLSNYGVFTGPGIFTVGRLTFTSDALGSIEGFTESRGGGNLMTFEYPIPEPLAMNLLLSLTGGWLLRRRRPTGRLNRFDPKGG